METTTYDVQMVCRTCKCVSANMRNVFEPYENTSENPRIDEMLMACTSIQATYTDGLSQLICTICLEQLRNAFVFKEKALKTDANLREHAKHLKVNEIKQELQNSDFMETLNTLFQETATENTAENSENTQPISTDFIQILENNQILLTCRECMKVFTTLEGLRCHKRIHVGNMFKCKQCDKEYTRLNHLQRHELSHGRRKVHVCRICSKTLTRMEHLKRHLATHLREKPYGCKTCNRGFNRVEHLHNHIPRCKGENVHICNICNRAFNREDSLEVHKKLHENQQPVLPTIENLDHIEDHYFEIDFDDMNVTFSDNSDLEDCFEPQVEVTENLDEDKIKEVAEITGQNIVENHVDQDEVSSIDDITEYSNQMKADEKPDTKENIDTKLELKEENKTASEDDEFEEEHTNLPDDCNDDDSAIDSSDEEYRPNRKPIFPLKRGRGRPRKNSTTPPKPKTPKVPGRGRGRPPGSGTKIKKELIDEEIGEFPCPICNEVFQTVIKLDKHARRAHEGIKIHKCEICKKEFNRANHLRRHLTSHSTEKPYQCTICTKSFNRKDHLSQHQKLHERQQEFECEICQKPFTRADHLAKHKASKHGIGEKIMSEKKYNCPLCNKAFTTEKYRDVHVRGHNGEKEYVCKTCQKSFLSKSHLTEHMKFHNDHSKKFLCSECGQRFIRNDYLVIHMRRHRGEKPFKCKFCGKGFPRTTDLTVHERYHTGEKTHLCTICGRGFGRAYNLTVHMRTHTGEKPYQCTYCDAAFAQGNDLKAHVRRHTGERFQCELCTESFLMGYLLTQHKRTVHGLNVVSNIRRLQPIHKMEENPDEPPPITIPLPKPVVPDSLLNSLQHQLAVVQLHHLARPEPHQFQGLQGHHM